MLRAQGVTGQQDGFGNLAGLGIQVDTHAAQGSRDAPTSLHPERHPEMKASSRGCPEVCSGFSASLIQEAQHG
ncbi:hypothetical protein GCM10025871_00350 [Deinococcus metallilatus]|nr:hypothetical protein GCM10025871_00350 [Deinococcus metallilatus]